MDGNTLQNLFAGSNPFLAQMGEQAFNQAQQKDKASLAAIMGQEQRAQAMHPLEMTARETTNRLNASTAGLNEYSLKSKVDPEQAKKAAMQKMLGEMDDTTRGQFKAQVTRNMQLAAMAKANGGMLPEGMQMSPEELQIFRPENLDKIIQHGQTFLEFDPEEIAKRQRAKEAEALAKVRGQVQMDVKGTPSPGSGNTAPTMDNAGIIAQLSKLKEARQKLAALKTILPQLTEEQQVQWQSTYLALKKQAEEELRARTAGDVDIPATTKGKVPVTPAVNLGDAPSAVSGRPARQAPPQVSQADIEFTAKKHGISVEEVKKRLGIK